jgi:hypothetical protein
VRGVARIFVSVLLVAGLSVGAYGCVVALQWLQSQGAFEAAFDRRPQEPVALSSLNRYTREAAGKASFRRYFTTMVYGLDRGAAGVVAKWERPRVVIKQLNDGGPGVTGYLRRLVLRLNRIQGEVRFVVREAAPLITISYLSHRDYVRSEGADSVGKTRTRYFDTSPGLISARISIDAGAQATPGQVRSTLVHELTHAIGCAGHFRSPDDRRRSVLHETSTITTWSQPDAAVIRILYSPWIRTGMTAAEATRSLRRYGRTGG